MGKLFQESGGSQQDRTNEALRIWGMIQNLDHSELPERDQKFLADMRERLQIYKASTFVSPQQIFWLRDIKDKLI